MRFVIIQKISLFSSDGTASTHFFQEGKRLFYRRLHPVNAPTRTADLTAVVILRVIHADLEQALLF